MIYIAKQFRVRVEFSRADCMESETPPDDLLERAKDKLRHERRAGRVAFFRIFKTRLVRVWQTLRESDVPMETRVGVTFVTGAPPMPGIHVKASVDRRNLATLTIDAPKEIAQTWTLRLVKLTVGKYLRRMDIKEPLNPVDIHVAWLKACRGEPVRDFELRRLDTLPPPPEDGGAYRVLADAQADAVSLVVYDVSAVLNEALCPKIKHEVGRLARQLKAASGKTYRTLCKDVLRDIKSAGRGPEMYGIDLPAVYLAGMADPEARAKTNKLHRLVTLEVSSDKLSAVVKTAAPNLHEVSECGDVASWKAFLSLSKIHADAMTVDDLPKMIADKKSVVGHVVARGRAAVPAKEPKLTRVLPVIEFAPGRSAEAIRESQQRKVVQAGQDVAKFVFGRPAEPGFDIFGNEFSAPLPDLPTVTLGEGVRAEGKLRFVATTDGVPEVTDNSIQLLKALTLASNVNLTSGNVHFTGPATINGSIEAGALVEIHGDLTVIGMIQGGIVKVGGKLTVSGGIISGDRGFVRVGGDISADFIENARVECGGSVTVNRSITASHIWAGGDVSLTAADGMIAGGEINAGRNIKSARFGRTFGPKTVARLGVPPKIARRLHIWRHRLAILKAGLERDRASRAELSRRGASHLTERRKRDQVEMRDHIERYESLIRRVGAKVEAIAAELNPNLDARLSVSGVLSNNSLIEYGPKVVPVKDDISGVYVSGRERNGTHFSALTEPTDKDLPKSS